MTRWFNEWARQFRPGTHYSSVGYGLTWQWVNVAHAHLDLSPAWRGKKPTAKDRAHYRQFADSLDERPAVRARLRPPQAGVGTTDPGDPGRRNRYCYQRVR
jgi:hypothetical protein